MKTYIRNIGILVVTLLFSGIIAKGETFSKDYEQVRLTFEITSDSTVSATWIDVLDTENEIDLRIPESVEYDGKTYTVTGFWYNNDGEFYDDNFDFGLKAEEKYVKKYGKIRSLIFPHTLTSMYRDSDKNKSYQMNIRGYVGLKKITIENASVIFPRIWSGQIKNLEEIDFGDSLIGTSGSSCSDANIKKIRLPESCNIGNNSFWGCESLSEIEWIPNNDPEKKGCIGSRAFQKCTSLKHINIPCDVEWSAFLGCTALENVEFLKDHIIIRGNAFEGCTSLKEIDLYNCTAIEEEAFLNCSSLRKVTFPDQIGGGGFGNSVFQGCVNLEDISVRPGKIIDNIYRILLSVQDGVLYSSQRKDLSYTCKLCLYPSGNKNSSFEAKKVTFGDRTFEITEIVGGAFANNENIEKVTIFSGQLKNTNTFEGCKSLREVNILPGGFSYEVETTGFPLFEEKCIHELPDSMVRIPYLTFRGCESLEKISIPDSYLMMGYNAFEGCKNLKEISLPSQLMHISNSAFEGCTSLKEITIPEKVIEIGGNAFWHCRSLEKVDISPETHLAAIGNSAFGDCISLKSITLPETLDSIGPSAFIDCHSLPEIRIPDNVTKLGRWAYENCKNAKTISIGNGIKEVDNFTFWGCSGAERLEIGENVESIGKDAFTGIDNLKVIICNSMTPPDYPTGFSDEVKENATLYVPEGASSAYYNDATWQPFTQSDAVEEVILDDIKVTSQNVEAPDGVAVDIYTFSGHIVASGKGSFSMNLAPGLYIVKTAGSVRKIAIR